MKKITVRTKMIPAEVEGGEKLVAKNGAIVKHFNGLPHSQGGIKTMLPEGHYVISKHDLDKDGISDAKAWEMKSDIEKKAYLKALDERKEGESDVSKYLKKYLGGGMVNGFNWNLAGNNVAAGTGNMNSMGSIGDMSNLITNAASTAVQIGSGIADTVEKERQDKINKAKEEQDYNKRLALLKDATMYKNMSPNNINTNPWVFEGKHGGKVLPKYKIGGSSKGYKTASGVLGTLAPIVSMIPGVGSIIGAGLGVTSAVLGGVGAAREKEEVNEANALTDSRKAAENLMVTENTNKTNDITKQISTNPYLINAMGGKIKKYGTGDPVVNFDKKTGESTYEFPREVFYSNTSNPTEVQTSNPEPELGSKRGVGNVNPLTYHTINTIMGSAGRELNGLLQTMSPKTRPYQPAVMTPPVMQADTSEAQRRIINRDLLKGFSLNRLYQTPTANVMGQAVQTTGLWNDLASKQLTAADQIAGLKSATQRENVGLQNQFINQQNANSLEAGKLNFMRGVEADTRQIDAAQRAMEAAQQQRDDFSSNKANLFLNSLNQQERYEYNNLQLEMDALKNSGLPFEEIKAKMDVIRQKLMELGKRGVLRNQQLFGVI